MHGRPALRLLLGVVAALCVTLSAADAQGACPPDCSGQTLTRPNYSHQNLAGANFDGATIIGGVFVRANLTGAHFDGATFQSVPGSPAQTPDFTLANLTNATFVGARFEAPTYFSYATLSCTDFSQTILNNGNAVFGDEPLTDVTQSNCRTKFQGATMSCEFIDQWRAFDLTGADVSTCLSKLAGRNFDHAEMANVHLDNAILDGAIFTYANLAGATLNNVSLQCAAVSGQCVDMSNARLQGAHLNNANLTGASLYNAVLSTVDKDGKYADAAVINQAHLKNVNLAKATLSGVDFTSSNFYGTLPTNVTGGGGCGSGGEGFTTFCASAYGAQMDGTVFSDAYLYGVDFRNATIAGVDFHNAVLVGIDFSGATIGTSATNGFHTTFRGAYLQGTNLDTATRDKLELTNAFVDFRGSGNNIYINLSGGVHNAFACGTTTCKPPSGQDVCVVVLYPATTSVPPDDSTMTCPDESAGNCGPPEADGSNPHWKSKLTIGEATDEGPPAGWYENAATYTGQAPDNVICNNKGSTTALSTW